MTNPLTYIEIKMKCLHIVNQWNAHTNTCVACQCDQQAICSEYKRFIAALSYWTLRKVQARNAYNLPTSRSQGGEV
jgi:hypothetical protein